MKLTGTKVKILRQGRSLLQRHGYHGFSFQDIADCIEIKKASLYDHYSSKEELILAILDEYSIQFQDWTVRIQDLSSLEKIQKVFEIFFTFTSDQRKVCPVLALTIDTKPLSQKIQKKMRLFVEAWLLWLEHQVRQGQAKSEIRPDLDPRWVASFIYNEGMGSQIQARLYQDPKIPLQCGQMVLQLLQA